MGAVLERPELQALLDYWLQKRGGRAMPARGDIDPAEIPRLLPDLGLVDVLHGGADFRFRLLGTRITELFHADFTGMTVGDIEVDHYRSFLESRYRRVVAERCPIYSETVFGAGGREHLRAWRLCVPLSNSGDGVDMILFMLRVSSAPKRLSRGQTLATLRPITEEIRALDTAGPGR